MIKERLSALREKMREHGMCAYLVPTSDYHSSEYVGEHFQSRVYMSGFTGSAGTLVVGQEDAALFVDGRYFLQAGRQIEGTGITLMRMGQPGVPTLTDYVRSIMPEGSILGVDGRTLPAVTGLELEAALAPVNGAIMAEYDLVGEIWENRPAMSEAPVFLLEEKYSGESRAHKLARLREKTAELGVDAHILTSLDDIMWLFNIRGSDIDCTPYALSYAAIEKDAAYLFIDAKKVPAEVKSALEADGITLCGYYDVYDFVSRYKGARVLLDSAKVNLTLYRLVKKAAHIVDAHDPTQLFKAVKNPVELDNIMKLHILDGVAVARTMRYAKEHAGEPGFTELAAAEFVETERAKIAGAMGPSFETIAGYKEHGAIVHYAPTSESDMQTEKRSFLLLDSGGQYLTGTTDITRTFAMGELTSEEKRSFATVLESMLSLQSARFLYGASGMNLDVLAREPFWRQNMDYNHGTGHGVGYLSGVHEGPNAFRYKKTPGRGEGTVLEAGMVTTDEPGIYIEGRFGVRLENELVCREGETNGYGKFMYFEPVTLCPIDLDAVDVSLIDDITRERLNEYHARVYAALSPHMDEEERIWLREYTRPV